MNRIVVATPNGLFDALGHGVVALEGRRVDALSPDVRWAIVDGGEVWHNVDGWSKVADESDLELTCVHAFDAGALIGTTEAHLLELRAGRLAPVEGFDSVQGRDEWFTPWGGPPAVRTIARSNGDVYVNVHVGGIVRGADPTWAPTIEIRADVHEVRTEGDALVVACARGFAESADRGATWTYDDEGLHATYARAVAIGRDHLFMSVAHGPRGGDAAVYRKPRNRTGSFSRCDLPSFADNIDTGCLDATDELVAFGTKDGRVFTSTDDGATWDLAAHDLPAVRRLVIER